MLAREGVPSWVVFVVEEVEDAGVSSIASEQIKYVESTERVASCSKAGTARR